MGLDTTRFARVRPCLYHLTARVNLTGIRANGGIQAASELMQRSGRLDLLTEKRPKHVSLLVEGRQAVLRDQAPLYEGNVRLEDGFGFADLVRHLNERVFFWPGNETSPIDYGLRHFKRYATEDCVVLVVPTLAALDAGTHGSAEFCRYNSGSPRCSNGLRSPRGPRTFVRADEFEGRASEVVEVVFRTRIDLPTDGFRVAELGEWV